MERLRVSDFAYMANHMWNVHLCAPKTLIYSLGFGFPFSQRPIRYLFRYAPFQRLTSEILDSIMAFYS